MRPRATVLLVFQVLEMGTAHRPANAFFNAKNTTEEDVNSSQVLRVAK